MTMGFFRTSSACAQLVRGPSRYECLPLAPPTQENHRQTNHHDGDTKPTDRRHTARIRVLSEDRHERGGERRGYKRRTGKNLRGHISRLPEPEATTHRSTEPQTRGHK